MTLMLTLAEVLLHVGKASHAASTACLVSAAVRSHISPISSPLAGLNTVYDTQDEYPYEL